MLIQPGKRKFIFSISFMSLLVFFSASAQHLQVPVSKPGNRAILEANENAAQTMVSKNLNRFGLLKLMNYDSALDSVFNNELRDTLSLMEQSYLKNSAEMQTNLKVLNSKIADLTVEKEKLAARYKKLLKVSAIAFGAWLLMVILFMQFKRSKVRKEGDKVNKATSQLESIEKDSDAARKVLDLIRHVRQPVLRLRDESEQLNKLCTQISDAGSAPVEWSKDIKPVAEKLAQLVSKETRLAESFISQEGELSEEKESSDINRICDDFLEIAQRGISSTEDFSCQVTRDFEKNLPAVKISPAAVGSVLLNVLNNSFQSVRDKHDKGIKGYAPKISVSTRILPRFVQIRVKDNGEGMPDTVLQKATDDFFSTRSTGKGAGLGLFESKRIMNELHKGEIKIESEEGNSTDVYIKFFI